MSLVDAAERLTSGARAIDARLATQIQAVLAPARAAKRLFLDAEGKPTFDAGVFFAMVAREGYVNRSGFHADARVHAYREGARDLALKILDMVNIDHERLAALVAMRSEDDDE